MAELPNLILRRPAKRAVSKDGGNLRRVAILRDASLRDAPQDEGNC
jgi:hypothetical protein